ncbi:FAD-dependent monooxygenase [Leifsonia sp. 2TAF2]|uniref:FAD-dependent monooxygenase n=1 Tax=Leifsonia sp. 2TAF2 TaxID=3233009 RepID=UPI003F964C2C
MISGAGVAGATLAFWLARDEWEVTLVEKADTDRSSGSPVDVRGPAVEVVRAMGIVGRLRSADTGVDQAAFVNRRGNATAVIRTRSATAATTGRSFEVPRAELASALAEAATAETRVVKGDSITALAEDRHGVTAEFERAGAERFDLVFGADGLHSAVRRIAFGPEHRYARPFGMFIATMRTPIDIQDPRRVLLYNEPNRVVAVHPAGGDPGVAFIFRSGADYDHRDPEAGRRLVENTYARSGWRTAEFLDTWRSAEDIYFDAVTRIATHSWSRGRIALVGDAASCLSVFGEGSSNAIIAGKTLADALRSHPGDHGAAFDAYERAHRPRVRRTQRGASAASHFLVPATGAGIRWRSRVVRALSLFR